MLVSVMCSFLENNFNRQSCLINQPAIVLIWCWTIETTDVLIIYRQSLMIRKLTPFSYMYFEHLCFDENVSYDYAKLFNHEMNTFVEKVYSFFLVFWANYEISVRGNSSLVSVWFVYGVWWKGKRIDLKPSTFKLIMKSCINTCYVLIPTKWDIWSDKK